MKNESDFPTKIKYSKETFDKIKRMLPKGYELVKGLNDSSAILVSCKGNRQINDGFVFKIIQNSKKAFVIDCRELR